MNAIEIKNVTKKFGSVTALDAANITLEHGKIYGLLGRNGAGKSTLLNIITNRLFADSGTVTIDGMPAAENDTAQAKVYMMGEANLYPPSMRVSETFVWAQRFYENAFDMEYALKLGEAFSLNPRKRVKELSTGYSTIFKLIIALSLQVPYVLLDEPVLGLDANHRDLLYRTLLENYAQSPRTFVVSTHLIEEVSSLIEQVIIIRAGKIIQQTDSQSLLASGYAVSGPAAAVDAFLVGKNIIGQDALGGLKTAYVLGETPQDVPASLEISRMDLQRLFIQLTN